jgi:DNA-binding transcriptional ArsR family regulator
VGLHNHREQGRASSLHPGAVPALAVRRAQRRSMRPATAIADQKPRQAGQFGLTYAVRGIARVWEGRGAPTVTDAESLAALLGRARAAILRRTSVPMSTTQLARELQQSPASVNEHLAVLRNAGLLTSRRSGRSVLYRQTPLAEYIVSAQQDTGGTLRSTAHSAAVTASPLARTGPADRLAGQPGQARTSPIVNVMRRACGQPAGESSHDDRVCAPVCRNL